MTMVNINAEIKNTSQALQAKLSSLTQNINAEISTGIIYAISPTAKIEKLPNGDYRITITDKNGTTTADIQSIDTFVQVRTTKEWNEDIHFQSKKGIFYIYSDYKIQEQDGKNVYVPGIKVGDGLAYVVDLPFVNDSIQQQLNQHVLDSDAHVTLQEKEFWNGKVTCFTDSEDSENLIFSKN